MSICQQASWVGERAGDNREKRREWGGFSTKTISHQIASHGSSTYFSTAGKLSSSRTIVPSHVVEHGAASWASTPKYLYLHARGADRTSSWFKSLLLPTTAALTSWTDPAHRRMAS